MRPAEHLRPLAEEEIADAVIDALRAHGMVSLTAYGTSMWPAIRSGSQVPIHRVDPADLEVGDVILHRAKGRLILHRVVKKDEHGVHTRGDAYSRTAGPFPYRDVLGAVDGLVIGRRVWRNAPRPLQVRLGRAWLSALPILRLLGRAARPWLRLRATFGPPPVIWRVGPSHLPSICRCARRVLSPPSRGDIARWEQVLDGSTPGLALVAESRGQPVGAAVLSWPVGTAGVAAGELYANGKSRRLLMAEADRLARDAGRVVEWLPTRRVAA